MSTSLIVATILVAGWNLALTATALLTRTGPFRATAEPARQMSRSVRSVRAEIGEPDLDARTDVWKRNRGMGTAEVVRSRIADTQQEVTTQAPYAEASVTVAGTDGEEARRCSVCMN